MEQTSLREGVEVVSCPLRCPLPRQVGEGTQAVQGRVHRGLVALEVDIGPYRPARPMRPVVATTDPESFPERSSWYLTTNLPAPGSERAKQEGALPVADLVAVVRMYGLRMWVEQGYKQVKGRLGWAQYQVRSNIAMRRHGQMVCLAFSFCSWQEERVPESAGEVAQTEITGIDPATSEVEGRGKMGGKEPTCCQYLRCPVALSLDFAV